MSNTSASDTNPIQIGCVTITWNQFKKHDPDAYPEARILGEVRDAGFAGVSTSPKANQTPQETVAYLQTFGLVPAPGYLGGAFWKPETHDDTREKAKRQASFAASVGMDTLFVAPTGSDYVGKRGKNRREIAGNVQPEDSLPDDDWKRMADFLNELGDLTLQEGGVHIAFHNHVGLAVESQAETERLLQMTDPTKVFFGPDTGHLAWAGADVVEIIRRYAPRIKALHLKDVHQSIRTEGVEKGWGYAGYVSAGIFAELGEGDVDFPAIFAILHEAKFSGWALSETDYTMKPSALESATISRNYLHKLGL